MGYELTPEEYQQAKANGYSDAEIIAKGMTLPRVQSTQNVLGIPGARYLQPGEQAQSFPSPLQYIGENVKKNWPEILSMAVTGMMGGGPLNVFGRPITRIGTGAAIGGGSALLKGEDPLEGSARLGGSQAGGEILAKGGQLVGQGALRNRFINERLGELANYFKRRVPDFKDIPSDTAGIRRMFYEDGNATMHNFFDKALENVKTRGAMENLSLPKSVANDLDIPIKGETSPVREPFTDRAPVEQVIVNAADAAAAAVGKWKKYPDAYRMVQGKLDQANIGDPAAREAYRSYMGVKDYFDKVGAFKGNKFNMEDVMQDLTSKNAGPLLNRNLQTIMQILKPEGQLPLEQGTMAVPGAALGALAGGMSGLGLGPLGHLGGAGGGAYLGGKLGSKIPRYINVPMPPDIAGASQAAAAGLGSLPAISIKSSETE